ncbi:MAG TPA: ATP-binding protein [Thermoanaerobaculia bacterium]|nr:ATP-binding protein [Thermoanaerobaculia bacterium]
MDSSRVETRPGAVPIFTGLRERIAERITFENRVLLLSLAIAVPGFLATLALLWTGNYSTRTLIVVSILMGALVWKLAQELRIRVVRPLHTLANLLEAVHEGDFSLRARLPERIDALGQVMHEINAIAETLREQRLGAVEATALLHRVMEEVDVAIFALDDEERLRLVNRAGERLLAEPAERLLGQAAEALGLAELLEGETARTVAKTFPSGPGRWEIRRSLFREQGRPHKLLVITDLSQPLREEERQAWKRLIRVLGHELNNSLAPIRSMASTLGVLLEKQPEDWREDMRSGLDIITNRSDALIRFMAAYARMAKLPPPSLAPLDLSILIRRIAALETRLPVFVENGPPLTLSADADQIEQLLINLVRNGVDAAMMTHGTVGIGWRLNGSWVEVRVEDEGPGISNSENLFVPFYTTKPEGSGIGLALSRQIAEAHGGTLTLENRKEGRGCEALLRLPR